MFWPSMMFETASVISKRMRRISKGGVGAITERNRMVTEKMFAAMQAGSILACGGDMNKVMKSYRKRVRANARRLK
jgi:hypothetical protein